LNGKSRSGNKAAAGTRTVWRAFLPLLLAAWALAGCTRHDYTERFGYADPGPGQKNILVPAEASGLAEELEKALRARGWNTLEPETGPGEAAAENRVALYTLKVQSEFMSKCVTWDDFVQYEISVVDNRTGETLFTMKGQRCDSKVVHQFMSMMDQKAPPRR